MSSDTAISFLQLSGQGLHLNHPSCPPNPAYFPLSVTAQHSPGLTNTVRHWIVMRVNGVFRLKGELESSASMMVFECLLGTCASVGDGE